MKNTQQFEVGQKVIVSRINGEKFVTVIRHVAHESKMVWLRGLAAAYPMNKVKIIKPEDLEKYKVSY